MPEQARIVQSLQKSLRTLFHLLPLIVGMLLLTSLLLTLLPHSVTTALFGHGEGFDALTGAAVGSVAVGHPLASYLLGGELLHAGVGLVAVSALMVSWVSVGVVQLPAEGVMLGWRFALLRNAISFVAALLIALATVTTLHLLEAG